MFAECPYALHLYCEAYEKGASPDASPLLRQRYLCCRISSSHQYARDTVATALREFFYYSSTDQVTGWVLRRLARDQHLAGRGEAGGWLDPENVEGAVRDLLQNPFLPELLERLRKVRPIDRVLVPVPIMTELAGLTLCAAPVLAFREGLLCWFLTFENHPSIDTVISRYALARLKLPPARVRFLRFDGSEQDTSALDFSMELDHIFYSAGEMFSGICPKTADRSVCRKCRFRFCCDD